MLCDAYAYAGCESCAAEGSTARADKCNKECTRHRSAGGQLAWKKRKTGNTLEPIRTAHAQVDVVTQGVVSRRLIRRHCTPAGILSQRPCPTASWRPQAMVCTAIVPPAHVRTSVETTSLDECEDVLLISLSNVLPLLFKHHRVSRGFSARPLIESHRKFHVHPCAASTCFQSL